MRDGIEGAGGRVLSVDADERGKLDLEATFGTERQRRPARSRDRTTVAAVLVFLGTASLVIFGFANRHDHSTHDHSNTAAVASATPTDAAAEEARDHDHSTHDHSQDLGATFASTQPLSASCRSIIGCDEAGPSPQSPGDRGGWAQFLTLGAVGLGIAVIAIRIVRSSRKSPSNLHTSTETPT